MTKLDIIHHKFIVLVGALIVLVLGILFGVQLGGAAGLEGLSILNFGLLFLAVVLLFLIFTQVVHVIDSLERKRGRSRKGQAALEFLTTYGWAILIVLVMIGALSYFGVTNPKQYLPDKCVFKVGLSCSDYIVRAPDDTSDMEMRFTLQNDLGESISITGANATFRSTTFQCGTVPGTLASGDSGEFICAGLNPNPGLDQSVKFAMEIVYRPVQGTYERRAAGEISTTVQQG